MCLSLYNRFLKEVDEGPGHDDSVVEEDDVVDEKHTVPQSSHSGGHPPTGAVRAVHIVIAYCIIYFRQ